MLSRSSLFDYSLYTVAGAYYCSPPLGEGFFNTSLRGAQYFAITSIFDKLIRALVLKSDPPRDWSPPITLANSLLEEFLYSGVLLTESKTWIIPRFLVAFSTGVLATTALTGRVNAEQNNQWLKFDQKVAIVWAIFRELILRNIPQSSIPLRLLDSCMFGLAYVMSPTQEDSGSPKFSRAWSYQALSAAFFRLTANTVAAKHGILTAIVQHLFFTFSQNSKQPEVRAKIVIKNRS
ncbi:MAG: hypothetical protein AAF443_00045 [Chlamydiota bacterium]